MALETRACHPRPGSVGLDCSGAGGWWDLEQGVLHVGCCHYALLLLLSSQARWRRGPQAGVDRVYRGPAGDGRRGPHEGSRPVGAQAITRRPLPDPNRRQGPNKAGTDDLHCPGNVAKWCGCALELPGAAPTTSRFGASTWREWFDSLFGFTSGRIRLEDEENRGGKEKLIEGLEEKQPRESFDAEPRDR
jgi:hypothetical protein